YCCRGAPQRRGGNQRRAYRLDHSPRNCSHRNPKMKLFKADTQGAFDKTRRKLADVEASIAALQASRAEKLAQTDEIAAVQTIDRAIEAERNAVEIYNSRIAILEEQKRAEAYASRELERRKAIAGIEKKLAARQTVAEELERTVDKLGELYFRL